MIREVWSINKALLFVAHPRSAAAKQSQIPRVGGGVVRPVRTDRGFLGYRFRGLP
jgi:hypothetical protein